MTYECDNDNHDIGCQCPGVVPEITRLRTVLAELVELHTAAPHARCRACHEVSWPCPTRTLLARHGLT